MPTLCVRLKILGVLRKNLLLQCWREWESALTLVTASLFRAAFIMEEYLSQITHRSFANSMKMLSTITEMLFWSQRNRDSKEERSSSTAEVAGGSFPARLTAGRQGWGRPAVDIQTCALSSQEVLISTQRNLTQRIIIHSLFKEKDRRSLMYWVIFTSAWITEKQNVLVKCQPWAWRTILHKFKVHIFELKQSTTGSREDPVLWKNNRKWRVSTKYKICTILLFWTWIQKVAA